MFLLRTQFPIIMVFDMPVLKETIMYVSLFLSTGVREFLAV